MPLQEEIEPVHGAPRRPPLRIGLAGFGTVGQALQSRLQSETAFEIAAILVRDPHKKRRLKPRCEPVTSPAAFFETGFDILVDVTSGAAIGRGLICRQLAGMRDAVSANKAAIAANLRELRSMSHNWGGRLRYSAAVGGSAPMLETARRARSKGEVAELIGVLSGTVNFILDEMSRGTGFDAALAMARMAGFAEEDCEADLDGSDVAAKLRILAAEIWDERGMDIPIEIEALDAERRARIAASGERWVQAASVQWTGAGIAGAIWYALAGDVIEIPPLPAEWNYLVVRLETGELLKATGRGAGGDATAEAIMADLLEIAAAREPRG